MPLFETEKKISKSSLADRFIVSPFSILRRAYGQWPERKKFWLNLGIASSEGRDTKRYNAMPTNIGSAKHYDDYQESISVFDPALCEIMYKWFSKEGDKIIDPFAGGSVRGIIASVMGRDYVGIDLSQKQVLANWEQYQVLSEKYIHEGTAIWISGDSEYALDEIEDGSCQMFFTCPPYYNLEQYTRDPRDLSRQKTYEAFLAKYSIILQKSISKLDGETGSFAVVVVGEVRDENGAYYGLVPDTINIFRQAGCHYYDEIILEDSIGSLPLRGPKYFEQSRKIGKMHQNILVFYKGDLSKIREKCDSMNTTF